MANLALQINSKIEVVVKNEIYKSDIQDITESYIAITVPVKNTSYLPLTKGEEVSINYYDGKDKYNFESTVTGRTIDKIFLILLSPPRNIKLVQMRNYVRVAVVQDIAMAKLDKSMQNRREVLESLKFEKALLLDLSGGGIRIKTKQNLREGENVVVSMQLNNEVIPLKATVIRAEKQEDMTSICGLNFIDINEKIRELIIKQVFNVMREQRRKGVKEE